MAKPTINEIIEAIKNANSAEKRKLKAAFNKAGLSVGRDNKSSKISALADDIGESFKESTVKTAKELVDSLGKVEDVINPWRQLAQLIKSSNAETKEYFKAGYTGQMFDFSKSISAANKASLKFNGSINAGLEVNRAWRDSSKSLAFAGRELQDTLMRTSVVLQHAGIDTKDYAEIVDSAAFAFNKNASEISQLTSTLISVQREVPVSGRVLAENFRFAQKNFAYSAGKMMDNFIGLQKMSVTTGISFGSLTSAFGESMDSFRGSADKAGKLNQILGKSAFNSMEMLTMTETERATKVRSAIMESGRSIEDMGKFELLALKDAIGLGSVEETRKFLRGDLKIDEKKAMKAIEAKDPTAMKSKKLNQSLDIMIDGINKTRTPVEKYTFQMQGLAFRAAESSIMMSKAMKVLKDSGMTTEQALMTKAADVMGAIARDKSGEIVRDRTDVTGAQTQTTRLVAWLAKKIQEQEKKGDKGLKALLKKLVSSLGATAAAGNPAATMFGQGVLEDIVAGKRTIRLQLEDERRARISVGQIK